MKPTRPILTGHAPTDRALLALAKLLAEIAQNGPSPPVLAVYSIRALILALVLLGC